MTKRFCDLCEQPVAEFSPTLRVDFPDKQWFGTKFTPGSISVVDGTWTPHITARMIFEAHDTPRSSKQEHPDLCNQCTASILNKMANALWSPPVNENKTKT